MSNFFPKGKAEVKEKIKSILLKGKIIRYDGIEENPLEVMDRAYVNRLSHMSNILQANVPVEKVHFAHSVLHEAIAELKNDYCVRKVSCEYSGCCQYATYGVYLD